jgi:Ca-activated chloride channel homolog
MKTKSSIARTALLCALFLAAGPGRVLAKPVILDVSLANPMLKENETQRVFLKIGLTGAQAERQETRSRAPVNLALVIDKSGSMQGERIRQAREAAAAVVNRLRDDDIVSVVTFDSVVTVVVPATRATDRAAIVRNIETIEANGSTALYGGVAKGVAETRKFLARDHVNRVILLSDGQANVGPSSPGALGELGAAVAKDGMAVTTIGLGLGYNEDLMVRLARASDGNHAFVQNADDLVAVFDREFGEATSVVAQEVEIRIECAKNVRPVRTLGRQADISGQTVVASLNRVLGGQERYLMLEAEVDGHAAGREAAVADVTVSYRNLASRERETIRKSAGVRFTASPEVAEKAVDKAVMAEAVMQIGAANSARAVRLRDEGRTAEAQEVLQQNSMFLDTQAEKLDADNVRGFAKRNREAEEEITAPSARWNTQRKVMVADQYVIEAQQKP